MTYKIFFADTIEELEAIVNQKRTEGWNYVGGPAIVPSRAFAVGALKDIRDDVVLNLQDYSYKLTFMQAMDDKPIEPQN
jgi:hypothetical protein